MYNNKGNKGKKKKKPKQKYAITATTLWLPGNSLHGDG
jgi:hypothetical protein